MKIKEIEEAIENVRRLTKEDGPFVFYRGNFKEDIAAADEAVAKLLKKLQHVVLMWLLRKKICIRCDKSSPSWVFTAEGV